MANSNSLESSGICIGGACSETLASNCGAQHSKTQRWGDRKGCTSYYSLKTMQWEVHEKKIFPSFAFLWQKKTYCSFVVGFVLCTQHKGKVCYCFAHTYRCCFYFMKIRSLWAQQLQILGGEHSMNGSAKKRANLWLRTIMKLLYRGWYVKAKMYSPKRLLGE